MKALVVSYQHLVDEATQEQLGNTIAQIEEEEFETSPELFWVDINADLYDSSHIANPAFLYYSNGVISVYTPPETMPPTPEALSDSALASLLT